MSGFSVKKWRLDGGVYTSPRFADHKQFNKWRQHLIRFMIQANYDDKNGVIQITTKGNTGKANLEKMAEQSMI